ncbi:MULTISPECIES: hypothetical protein [Listeria]|uniref:hypothetical protein n=1 Tax=Listeria TaxID=1637 RepID=UPI000B594F67|nr:MULTISPECIES: hypothetical protein [Listeria]
MRFIIAYLTVFILGILAVLGIEALLFDALTTADIFSAILFAAPLVLVGSTIAEIFYGFSQKVSLGWFALYGFIYGLVAAVVILGIMQLAGAIVLVGISLLGGIISAVLGVIFFVFRGGKALSGRASGKRSDG